MKKATMIVQYDADKLKALQLYMKQKDMPVEAELVQALEQLYQKHVPSNVRFFIENQETVGKAQNPKLSKSRPSAVGGDGS